MVVSGSTVYFGQSLLRFLIPEWFHPLFERQLATLKKKYIHMDTTLFSSQMYL